MLILSASSLSNVVELLNKHFYSTTYAVDKEGNVTWKNGEIKSDLILIKKKNRFQIHQIKKIIL